MSKKTIIIISSVIILGIIGAGLWFYFNGNLGGKTGPTATTTNVYDPFGLNDVTNATSTVSTSTNDLPGFRTGTLSPDKLRQISTDPISGFSVTENPRTKKTEVHHILRANGNIYETYTDSTEIKRLSITTIPKVYESMWLPDGIRLIIRYLKDNTENIQTFSVKINPATSTLNEFEGGVDGNHLPDNIGGIAINPLGSKVYYFTTDVNGSYGYTADPTGLNKKLLFSSPLIEWLVAWPKEEIITLNTKPAASAPGYLYFLNSKTGSLTHILGGINGLTTKTNSTATEILYSDSSKALPQLYLLNVKNGESKLLPWNTLPEKCLWSNTDAKIVYCAVPKSFPAGEYPDAWYQGLVNFTDDVWMINTETMASSLVFDINSETNNNIDVSEIKIDKTDNFLFFTNKRDLTFWSLNIK
jgi:hypothetical protein